MRIAINGYFLTRPHTGFGSVTLGLLREFSRLRSGKFKFIVYTPQKVNNLPKNLDLKVIPEISWLPKNFAKIIWEQWQIPRQALRDKIHILHHLYPVYSLFGKKLKQITCIHDAIPWQFPKHYQYSLGGRLLRWFILLTARRADLITTVSKTSKRAIIRYFKVKKSRIKVVYNGISPNFFKKTSHLQRKKTLARFNLQPQKYILYVGGFEARKRVSFLVESFAQIAAQVPYHLVIPGAPSPQFKLNQDYYQLPRQIKRLGLTGRVLMLGRVSEKELSLLYKGAKLFLTATKAEGFNLPVVEAMASGAPVLASDAKATREIATNPQTGKPAVYLVPLSADKRQFSKSLVCALNNPRELKRLRALGFKAQTRFRWRICAQKILKLYSKINGT